jgi:hypothetical protein
MFSPLLPLNLTHTLETGNRVNTPILRKKHCIFALRIKLPYTSNLVENR